MAIYDYKTLALDTLAAIVGYNASIIQPPTPEGGADLNVFTGLTEPETKDGVWVKIDATGPPIFVEVFLMQSAGGTWDVNTINMPSGAYGLAGASVGTKVYVCGGNGLSTATRIYETTTGTWTTGSAMPNGDSEIAGASVGTKVYMIGGNTYRIITRIYETTTGVWTTGSSAPTNTFSTASAAVGTKVYICGGTYSESGVKAYETTTGVWTAGSAMPNGDSQTAGASVGTKVYVCGGNSFPTATRIYETTTGVWTTGNAMPSGTYALAGASVGTKVYMCGGYSSQTATRTLHLANYSYLDGSIVILSGTTTVSVGERIVKLLPNMSAVIADVWVANSGLLTSAETYVGNGVVWTKIKDAA